MKQLPPAQVCWVFAREDEPLARELLNLAAVLEDQGIIKSWSLIDVAPGQDATFEIEARARNADVVVLLISDALLREEMPVVDELLTRPYVDERVVLVNLQASRARNALRLLQMLPRDGRPLQTRPDRQEGLRDVIRGLREHTEYRQDRVFVPTPVTQVESRGLSPSEPVLSIEDIFPLDGLPGITFVEPPEFANLKHWLRTMGTGLIVEGPSRVGKSTAIKKAMEEIGVPASAQIWWNGRMPRPLGELQEELLQLERSSENRWLFIDDFHYIEDALYLKNLAFGMKGLADQGRASRAKITLIGINPLGGSLVQAMPDLAGRFRIFDLDIERDWQRSNRIHELILRGEHAANVRFKHRDRLIAASGGSFYLAQFLCNQAALKSGVQERSPTLVEISLGPEEVIVAIQKELAARYRTPLLELAAFDVSPPPRGAGLALLWLLSRSPEGFFTVKEARLRFPMLAAAFEWFLESNLSRCFRENPALRSLLYYSRATTTLTLEDPQLKFYLRELDWEKFAEASGHGRVSFHPEDGPLWVQPVEHVRTAALKVQADVSVSVEVRHARRLLHLSDLHFSTVDQATIFYTQLAADLRQQGVVDRLDSLVVSGDLVNRAEPGEYAAARLFLQKLMAGFSLSSRQVTLVPGNHDVSWALAEASYTLKKRSQTRGNPSPGTFIAYGTDVFEVREEDAYRRRMEPFSKFYREIKGEEYPLDYAEQATFDDPLDAGLLVLGLNSAWEIDHHFRDRASIHAEALARSLDKLGPPGADQLRVAVFHHPIHSGEDSRIRDPAFLQQLALHGFRLALHGHVHKADAELYRYDRSEGGRRLEIVAAGTFGAPTGEWVFGYPLQYNLLHITPEQITVETRCRTEVNGAWSPDARWQQGAGKDPLPRYVIKR